jgi:transcriptional regulator with XRE-family HTH domain
LKDIKQETLAKQLGLRQQELSRIENSAEIKDELLERIADALGVSANTIRDFDSKPLVNSYNQSGGNVVNYQFNPIEKIIDLYEERIKDLQEIIALLKAKS